MYNIRNIANFMNYGKKLNPPVIRGYGGTSSGVNPFRRAKDGNPLLLLNGRVDPITRTRQLTSEA